MGKIAHASMSHSQAFYTSGKIYRMLLKVTREIQTVHCSKNGNDSINSCLQFTPSTSEIC